MNLLPRPSRITRVLSLLGLLVFPVCLLAAPPAISQQPAVVTATDGAEATFSVTATAIASLSYQWRHLGVPLAGGSTDTLTLPSVHVVDAGFYDVVVTAGGESTVSQPGRLFVQPAVVANTFRADPTFSLVAELAGGQVSAVRLTAAGEVLIGGTFTTIAGSRRDGLARLNASFAYDSSFAPAVAGAIQVIVEQPDGRILVGGGFTHVNGVPRSCLARLNADGSLDATFFTGAGFNGNVYALALQPDGRIVVGGGFTQFDGTACSRIARLNADGSLDPTFSAGTGFDSTVTALARQSDGRLVVGGYFANVDGHPAARLARLQSGGGFDATFVLGTGFNADVLALTALADNRLLVGGAFTSYAGTTTGRVVLLAADGSRDTTFTAPGGIDGAVRAVALAPSGRFVVGGDFTGLTQRVVARLNADGTVDGTWVPPTAARPASSVYAVASYTDGRVVAGGGFTQLGTTAGTASGLVRFNANGTLSAAPTGALRLAATITAAAPAAGGRWVVGGTFTTLNGVARNRIARIESTGALDATFNPGTGFDWTVDSITAQGDGRLLVSGQFSAFNGGAAFSLVRLEATGALDSGFALDPGIDGTVSAVAIQPDGRIVAGGDFDQSFGSARNDLARVLTNGDLDPTFNTGAGQSGPVLAVAIQRSGRIVAGGTFTQFNAQPRGRAARFDAAGALDTGFNAGTGFDGQVNAAVVRADDSLVLGGSFQNLDGGARRGAAAFASAGGLVSGYNNGAGFAGGAVLGLDVLPDGRLLAAGSFTSFAGQPAAGLLRLAADGTADTAFTTFDRSIGQNRGVIDAGDGRILVLAATAARGAVRQIGLVVLRPESTPLPAIGTAPATQTVAEGANVTLTVTATGPAPLHYQWSRNGVALAGATASTLSLSGIALSDAATYSVVVRNDYGSASASAVLTVTPAATYANWAAAHFTAGELADPTFSGPLADPYGAGVTNLQRYAFGLPARGPVAVPTQVLLVDNAGQRYLAVRFNRAAGPGDLVYSIEASANLTSWTLVEVLPAGATGEQTVQDAAPLGSATRRFLRVRIDLVP